MGRSPASNGRGASFDHCYGILVMRVTAKDMRGGKASRKKIDSGNERGPPKSSRLRASVQS